MKAVLKGIIYLLVLVVVVAVGGAYLISPVAVVERAAVIKAPPKQIYAIASDLRRFNEWSPWHELDPSAAYSLSGPEQGVGQKMSWTSDKPEVGSGSQTITEAEINKRIVTELDFGQMGKAHSYMTLSAVPDGTAVVWGFKSDVGGIMERWTSLMFDKWIGADYEKGLAKLKAVAERPAASG
jgi:hypothetical protein